MFFVAKILFLRFCAKAHTEEKPPFAYKMDILTIININK